MLFLTLTTLQSLLGAFYKKLHEHFHMNLAQVFFMHWTTQDSCRLIFFTRESSLKTSIMDDKSSCIWKGTRYLGPLSFQLKSSVFWYHPSVLPGLAFMSFWISFFHESSPLWINALLNGVVGTRPHYMIKLGQFSLCTVHLILLTTNISPKIPTLLHVYT